MANTLSPSGFHPVARADGAAPNYRITTMRIAYNLANKIGYGDPVKLLSTGFIDVMGVGGSTISGIFLGCYYFDPNNPSTPGWRNAWTAPSLASTTIVTAKVLNDPSAVLQCQVDGTVSGALTQADVGKNIDISATSGAPNSQSGISVCALDGNTKATTPTLPFKILSIVGLESGAATPAINPSYDPTASNNWITVTFNTNALVQTTGI